MNPALLYRLYHIPEKKTTLLGKNAGDIVNLENDVIGKYVERLLGIKTSKPEKQESKITMEFLETFGF